MKENSDNNGSSKYENADYDIGGTVTSGGSPKTNQLKLEMAVHRYHGLWIRAAQLPELFSSWDLAYRCTKSGWLKPVLQGKRRTIYRLTDVLTCMQRIEAGELPLPRSSKTAR